MLLAETCLTVSHNWCDTKVQKLSLGCTFDVDNSALTRLRPSLSSNNVYVVGTSQDDENSRTA